jgi:hypothetical protein
VPGGREVAEQNVITCVDRSIRAIEVSTRAFAWPATVASYNL